MTALHWATSLNFVDIARLLIKSNADPNLLDFKNQTPLEKAITNGHEEIVEIFTEHRLLQTKCRQYFLAAIESSNTKIFKSKSIISFIFSQNVDVHFLTYFSRILLAQVKLGRVNFDLNLVDESIGSLLHYAVILCNVNNIASGKQLQTTNDLNLSEFLKSPISKIKIIEALIETGVEINSSNKLGETPLHMCKNLVLTSQQSNFLLSIFK